MFRVASLCVVGASALMTNQEMVNKNLDGSDAYIALFKEKSPELEEAFLQVYDKMSKDFDVESYKTQLNMLNTAVSFLKDYKTSSSTPHCDYGIAPAAAAVKGVSAFPGGVVSRLFGFDVSKMVADLASKSGAAGAAGGMPQMLAMNGLATGAGLIQAAMSTVLQIVPPMIPPPVWINQPLPCMPMVTGHNCVGSVLYPITAADFVTADVTDAQLDGTIASFPALYKDRVGKTGSAAYSLCFKTYMSMQCGAIFPRCSTPTARNEPTPVGRLPLCFTSCIATLVACPGFWITDIADTCSTVSAPPMCTMALYLRSDNLPPQYSTFEESAPVPAECPVAPASLAALENAGSGFDIYSTGSDSVIASPYFGSGSAKVPSA